MLGTNLPCPQGPRGGVPASVGWDAQWPCRGSGDSCRGVSEAELSPEEGAAIAALLEAQRKIIETADIDERLRKVEEAQAGGSK